MNTRTRLFVVTTLCMAMASAIAQASETCEEMRDRIEKQALAKGVVKPQVLIVTAEEARAETQGKVVASCGQGTRRIVLRR